MESTEALNAEPSMLKLWPSYHLLYKKWGRGQIIEYIIQNIFTLEYQYLNLPFNIIVCYEKET